MLVGGRKTGNVEIFEPDALVNGRIKKNVNCKGSVLHCRLRGGYREVTETV